MMPTIIQIIADSTKILATKKPAISSTNNYWMWIAAAELIIIGYLAFKLRKKSNVGFENAGTDNILEEAKSSEINMDNLMNNINKSRELYKALSAKCHPDRFAMDEEKRKIADELFQDITRHQRNYNKLLELQEIARQNLNINL